MSKTYFVSGHLDLKEEEFEEHYHQRILDAVATGASFVTCDARGTDSLSQNLISSLCSLSRLSVFHMRKSPRNSVNGCRLLGGFVSDEERDAAATAASDEDIVWVRPGRDMSGTAANLARRHSLRLQDFVASSRDVVPCIGTRVLPVRLSAGFQPYPTVRRNWVGTIEQIEDNGILWVRQDGDLAPYWCEELLLEQGGDSRLKWYHGSN